VPDEAKETLLIYGVSVVNGAQTTGAIHAAGSEHLVNSATNLRDLS
jgi:hypothetical protein